MKQIVNKYITKFLQIRYKSELPSHTGTCFVTPIPKYISQFIGIYPSNISIDTPLTNKHHIKAFGAKDSKEFSLWAWRDCGIVCVKMILDAKGKASNKTIMDLTNDGIELGGYILYDNGKFVDKGWFHNSLIALLNKYGVNAKMKKWQSIESVALDILKNKLVILSVIVPYRRSIKEDGSYKEKQNAKFGGHLLLAIGVKMDEKDIEGIYLHDPRGLEKYQENTFVPIKVFNKIFTNRTIVSD